MAMRRVWRSAVTFFQDGPGVTLLHESKVVLVARRWAGPAGSHGTSAWFHFFDGEGVMDVGTEAVEGATVVVPTGALRGLRAMSRLVFLESLGDPASENGPYLFQQVGLGADVTSLDGIEATVTAPAFAGQRGWKGR